MNPLSISYAKLEKPSLIKLIKNHNNLLKNPNIFRIFEIFLIVTVISRLSFQIQPPISLVLTLSREYFHTLSLLLASPPFVFLLGNAIVITLLVNSPSHYTERPKCPSRDRRKKLAGEKMIMAAIFATSPEERVVLKVYRRSASEIRARRERVDGGRLRRVKSNMEITERAQGYNGNCQTGLGCCKKVEKGHFPEDHMSNEEFKKTIDDFIAKQKFLRQEEDFPALEN